MSEDEERILRELEELLDASEEAWDRERLFSLLDELGIESGRIRASMLEDADRAIAVLEHAKGSSGIRNPASFAIANWRAGFDPRARRSIQAPRVELEEAAPALSAIELAWHLEERGSQAAIFVLTLMSSAIGRTGGFRPVLEAGFHVRERYDENGELVERDIA